MTSIWGSVPVRRGALHVVGASLRHLSVADAGSLVLYRLAGFL